MNIIEISDILLISIALLWLIAASVTDIKKREVSNWLNFSLIAIAFSIRLLASIATNQWNYFLYSLLIFIIFFLITNLFYYAKVFGGGDAKLLIALSVILATQPFFAPSSIFKEPFILTFIINSCAVGAIYSIIFTIFLVIKNKNKFSGEFKTLHKKSKIFRIIFIIISIAFLIPSFFYSWLLSLFFLFLIFPYLYIFVKAAENVSMIKKVTSNKLTEGDWLVEQVKVNNKIIKPSAHGLSLQDIKLLQKAKKQVLIKYGLPFVPVFLMALLISILFGNILFVLIKIIVGI